MLPAGCVEACPACPHRALTRAQSLARKTEHVHEILAPWADAIAAIQSVEGVERWGYRRSVRLAALHRDGRWQFGLHHREEILPIPQCPVHAPEVNAAVAELAATLPSPAELPLVWYVQSGAQATLVVRRCASDTANALRERTRGLAEHAVEGLWLHVHPATGKRVTTHRGWELLWGEPRSRDASGLLHGPVSFRQAIPALHASALDAAEAFLAPTHADVVLDLYSGAGSSLARWRRRGAATRGVELGAEAIECAATNAVGAEVLQGRCKDRVAALADWAEAIRPPPSERLLYLNPPRTGLEPEVRHWIAQCARPARAAYLSCSVHTLARDLRDLANGGYFVHRILPFDFLPQTRHVECLVLLARS